MTTDAPPEADVRRRRDLGIAIGVSIVAIVWLASLTSRSSLPPWKAVVLGAVEGLTEFLPVSSTGHLLVAGRLLGLGDGSDRTALATYVIAIQVGAIAAVVSLYRRRIHQIGRGAVGRDPQGRQLLGALVIAFVPAAIVGVAFESAIKDRLFSTTAIVIAWAIGGVFLVAWRLPLRQRSATLVSITGSQALVIGLAQMVALWPGTSRSLVTLVAGVVVGLSLDAAVEFTFLLGLGTLTAATTWDLVRHGNELIDTFGVTAPVLGGAVAFVTAVASVRWMTTYLRRHSLRAFGWYRLALAAVTAGLLAAGAI